MDMPVLVKGQDHSEEDLHPLSLVGTIASQGKAHVEDGTVKVGPDAQVDNVEPVDPDAGGKEAWQVKDPAQAFLGLESQQEILMAGGLLSPGCSQVHLPEGGLCAPAAPANAIVGRPRGYSNNFAKHFPIPSPGNTHH
eukprot:1498331-Amphidinium_carterae.1